MLWKRLPVSWKLFVVMAFVTITGIAVVMSATIWNMRAGFTSYLASSELVRAEPLRQALAADYDPANPGWPELAGNVGVWAEYVRRNLPPPRGAPPHRRPLAGDNPDGTPVKRRRGGRDPMVFLARLQLLGPEGDIIAQGAQNRPAVHKAEIADKSGKTIGWLGVAARGPDMNLVNQVFLNDQIRWAIYSGLAGLLIAGLAAYVTSRQFLRPVREIANAGERLSQGDYSIRLKQEREDELGHLIRQYNRLAENLEFAEKAQRKWISDTSHELKTPVAVIRAQIEAVQDGIRKANKTTLAEMHAATIRLNDLVADLNTIAQVREVALHSEAVPVDLSKVVKQACDDATLTIAEKNLTLKNAIAPGLTVAGNATRLRQVIDNLLENARRYTDEGGEIHVTLARVGRQIECLVEDTEPGADVDDLNTLFDRFYRVEESRNRSSGGSGLGLSIVRELVQAFGGTVALSRSALGGLRVQVLLPEYVGEGGADNG